MSATPANEAYYTRGRTILRLWIGVAAAPIAWALHLNVAYMLAAMACSPPLDQWLYGLTAAMLAVAAAGALICRRFYRDTAGAPQDAGRAVARTRFLAATGLLGAALFGVMILAQTVPVVMHQPC